MVSDADGTGDLGLERCTGCGSCTDSCPSARNGGIRPDEFVRAAADGRGTPDAWRCLLCHRCSMACPQGIDVAGLMVSIRNASSLSGDIPERFRRTGELMYSEGRIFRPNARTASVRADLGLRADPGVSERTLSESRKILQEAGFR